METQTNTADRKVSSGRYAVTVILVAVVMSVPLYLARRNIDSKISYGSMPVETAVKITPSPISRTLPKQKPTTAAVDSAQKQGVKKDIAEIPKTTEKAAAPLVAAAEAAAEQPLPSETPQAITDIDDDESEQNTNESAEEKASRKKNYWEGQYSPFITEKFAVIRDNEAWENIWMQLNLAKSEKEPLPKINFKKYLVVALFLGQQNSGGYSIEITRLKKESDIMAVYYKILSPPAMSMSTAALTQPYFLKKIKHYNLPFTFIKEE